MTQKSLSVLLRLLVAATGLGGAFLCRFVIGWCGREAWAVGVTGLPVWGLILFLLSVLAVYAVLFLAWRMFAAIGRDQSFTRDNSRRLKIMAWLFSGDAAAYLLVCGLLELALGLKLVPAVTVFMLAAAFLGLALAVICSCLSHLVLKAAELKQENELTV